MSRFLLALLSSFALGAMGCTTPCEELAEKRCACLSTFNERDACERRAADQRSKNPPSDRDEERCDSFLDTCDCSKLRTAAGKRACGLAE